MNLLAPLYKCADRLRFLRHADQGARGEDLAHRYLRRLGFVVAARNWRPPQGGGEIDLVAFEGESLVFVEVKSRVSGECGAPEREIDNDKMLALRRAARDYARRAGRDLLTARFDVIAITGDSIEHLRDAFPASL